MAIVRLLLYIPALIYDTVLSDRNLFCARVLYGSKHTAHKALCKSMLYNILKIPLICKHKSLYMLLKVG